MVPGSEGYTDHFPSTHETWIADQLREVRGGSASAAAQAAQQLRTHIMVRYREPLLAYAGASSFRTLSTPEDLVHGFFAERLHDVEYLRSWTGTGMKLRRWLCNGLLLHMFNEAKKRRRDARVVDVAAEALRQSPPDQPAADRAFDRAWARGVIERAVAATDQAMRAEGREDAWRLFARHAIDGLSQVAAASEAGLSEGEAKARLRLAVRRFRDAVAAELITEGVPPSGVQAEAEAIVSVFGQGL
jgi:DNA-directed RNA polymerase specialized sigma24 family protein